jgi:hypothetical protein
MKLGFLFLLAAAALLAAGCAGAPQVADTAREDSGGGDSAWVRPNWEYPIAAGVWYPGDGPLPEHPFEYYRVRCWPGCHDPGSRPRPQHY